MIEKILGIDPGTNSLGIAVREPMRAKDLIDQITYFSVDTFDTSTEKGKSLAAKRTETKQPRRLRDTRRRRLWATLQLLIDYKLCPMKQESLDMWRTYNKNKKLFRKYPIDDIEFENWIKLDFNEDGIADYSSPYQLRCELVTVQLDLNDTHNRYKLGRALYHIAQRRAFKSSKGETIASQEEEANEGNIEDVAEAMKASETKMSKVLSDLMKEKQFKTVGQAFAFLEEQGIRVRNSTYKPVRSMLENEIREIFEFQNELSPESELFRRLISTKKNEGTIFYKKPLKSQRGLVGKCTLEPQKPRCPLGHPEFEKFRAYSLLNNIRYRIEIDKDWQELSFDIKEKIFNKKFLSRVKTDFPFMEIRVFLENELNVPLLPIDGKPRINYKDYQSVSGCPVTARIIRILGKDWVNWSIMGNKKRLSHSKGNTAHQVNYTAMDLWNVCYDADDIESVTEFAKCRLNWDDEQAKQLSRLWSAIPQGYAMLSLKAIKNINVMLMKGLKYSDAVLMAKIPEITHNNDINWFIEEYQNSIKQTVSHEKMINQIVNSLIAQYKCLPDEFMFAYKDFNYTLAQSDYQEIEKQIIACFGKDTWAIMTADKQQPIINEVSKKYQQFFNDPERKFFKSPILADRVKELIKLHFPLVSDKALKKLYHPSQISIYQADRISTDKSKIHLPKPNMGSIKNPTVLRSMHILRKKINAMLDAGIISPDDTRPVIELPRDLNDANTKWAIETYNRTKQEERKKIEKILRETFSGRDINDIDVDKALYLIDQKSDLSIYNGKGNAFAKDIKKYKLWLEQGGMCMYTGNIINLSNLFDGNAYDIEHTIPRSVSFDNSDINITVCNAHYNRYIKKDKIPTQLPNYEHDITIGGVPYTAIKPRLNKWEERVEQLRKNVEMWKSKSKYTQTKERKDFCIRQRHLWNMELSYWRNKLERFTMREVKDGFRNSQLVDTGTIAKHMALYLKSVFNHVNVQKGKITEEYRKILGVQSLDEKKNRSHHSHHAIDAVVLTTIPVAAKRERMLKLFYEIQEATKENHDCTQKKSELKAEIDSCQLGNRVSEIPDFIDSHIIVNRKSKDQFFTPSQKRVRVRGKVVINKGTNKERWTGGDSARGRLHKDTFYGAIRLPKGKQNDGKFSYDEKTKGLTIAVRIPITAFNSLNDLDIIIDPHLKNMLDRILKERMDAGMSFTKAINQEIWMLDRNGKEIKQDKNGRRLAPLRHVRCKVKAGIGFMTFETSLDIKSHTHQSQKKLVNIENRNYKKFFYAQNDTNYLFLLYEGMKKGKIDRKSRIINNLEAVKIAKEYDNTDLDSLFKQNQEFKEKIEKGISYHLKSILKVGTRILLWKDGPEEIFDIKNNTKELSKRLYRVVKFNYMGSNCVYLSHHLNAKSDAIDQKLVAKKLNCLVEHQDFIINDLGNIIFIDD